jgi:peptide/nickel transport system substrate-binding protein
VTKRSLTIYFALIVIFSLVISACQPGAAQVVQAGSQFAPTSLSSRDCAYGGELHSVEALDRSTVRFTLCNPDAAFLSKLAVGIFGIQESSFLNATGGNAVNINPKPNGTGPYQLESWNSDKNVVLIPNPNYWGVPPRSSQITFTWQATQFQRMNTVVQDVNDVVDNPLLSSLGELQTNKSVNVLSRPGLNVVYLGMNNSIPPFDNLNVRQAFAQIIDRKTLVDKTFTGGSLLADQLAPPILAPGYSSTLRWYDFNADQATQLLTQAGFNYGKEITLAYSTQLGSYLPSGADIATELKSQLAFFGINVLLKPMFPADFADAIYFGREGLFLQVVQAEYADPSAIYNLHLTRGSREFGTLDATLTANVAAAVGFTDPLRRQEYYDKINQMIKDQLPLIPLGHSNPPVVTRTAVEGAVISPLNENLDEVGTDVPGLRFLQSREPTSLVPGDVDDQDSLRVTGLIYDTLVRYKLGSTQIQPSLADSWTVNSDLTQWTFNLRYGIKFSNGEILDANDVVATFAAIWDADDPNHKGNTGEFAMFQRLFGNFISLFTRGS